MYGLIRKKIVNILINDEWIIVIFRTNYFKGFLSLNSLIPHY